MIVRYAIANVKAFELAHKAQDVGLSGSVHEGYGFGSGYGVEPCVFIEMATGDHANREVEAMDKFVKRILFTYREVSAYRTIDGQDASLLHVTGRVDRI